MIRKKRAPRRPAFWSHRLKFDHRLVLTSWMLDLFDGYLIDMALRNGDVI